MAAVVQPRQLPLPNLPWVDPTTGRPTTEFALYMKEVDAVIRATLVLLNSTSGLPFLLTTAGQNISAGFTESEVDLGTPVNASTVTAEPLTGLKQKLTNNVAGFAIAPPPDIGDLELRVVNGATAGTITFPGFTKKFAGDALTTTNGDQFIVFIYGFGGGKSAYLIKALQ